MTPAETLAQGRVWFATRPQFVARMRGDCWRCGGFFCEWHTGRLAWCAWSRTHAGRYAQTPADALKAVGYIDPVAP